MNQLISLLLDNIYFVIIAVGFLISMLSKARKGKAGRRRMPDFGGNGPFGAPASDEPEEAPSAPRQNQNRRQPLQAAAEEHPRAVSETAARAEGRRSSPLASSAPRGGKPSGQQAPSQASASSAGEPAFRMPEGDELKRAIILAEVLGPPRSKRPLRRL